MEEINIEVTSHCNKACSICPMRDRYKKDIIPLGYMDIDLFKRLVDECVNFRPELNLHKDGEPLMHPQIGEMIKYAKDMGFFVHFATNGMLLDQKKEEIVESGLDLLTISVCDKIPYESIEAFMEYKGTRKPITQIKVYGDRDDLPQADRVIRRQLHEWTDSDSRKTLKPCSKLLTSMAITWDGYYSLCCVDYKREMTPLHVKSSSIEEAWKFNKMIYREQEMGTFFAPCKNCNYWED